VCERNGIQDAGILRDRNTILWRLRRTLVLRGRV
jgi:hypothetical protein